RRAGGAAGAIVVLASVVVAWNRVAAAPVRRIPTARVQRGRVQVTVHTSGELRAARSLQLIAPPIGGNLQIVKLAASGEPVKSNELVGAIQAQQNLLLLEEARQRLAQIEKEVASHNETNRAAADVVKEKRNKAQLAVQVAERNIASLQIRAPFDGFVVLRQNFDALGGFCCVPGMTPDYRVGDSVFSGRPIADVIDTSRIEVSAKVPEQDRANVTTGEPVE